MPLPYKNVRYRYKTISPNRRQRLAFVGNDVVEVANYTRRNGWVKSHTRRISKRSKAMFFDGERFHA